MLQYNGAEQFKIFVGQRYWEENKKKKEAAAAAATQSTSSRGGFHRLISASGKAKPKQGVERPKNLRSAPSEPSVASSANAFKPKPCLEKPETEVGSAWDTCTNLAEAERAVSSDVMPGFATNVINMLTFFLFCQLSYNQSTCTRLSTNSLIL